MYAPDFPGQCSETLFQNLRKVLRRLEYWLLSCCCDKHRSQDNLQKRFTLDLQVRRAKSPSPSDQGRVAAKHQAWRQGLRFRAHISNNKQEAEIMMVGVLDSQSSKLSPARPHLLCLSRHYQLRTKCSDAREWGHFIIQTTARARVTF